LRTGNIEKFGEWLAVRDGELAANVGLGGLRCPVAPLLRERRERLKPRRFPDEL
jgi:hypothetical protein